MEALVADYAEVVKYARRKPRYDAEGNPAPTTLCDDFWANACLAAQALVAAQAAPPTSDAARALYTPQFIAPRNPNTPDFWDAPIPATTDDLTHAQYWVAKLAATRMQPPDESDEHRFIAPSIPRTDDMSEHTPYIQSAVQVQWIPSTPRAGRT